MLLGADTTASGGSAAYRILSHRKQRDEATRSFQTSITKNILPDAAAPQPAAWAPRRAQLPKALADGPRGGAPPQTPPAGTHIDNADRSNLVEGISRFGAKYDSISMVLSNIEAAMNSPTHREFACALIIDTFGRFLLQQRDDIPSIIQAGKIGMFGGHREARESFLECVAREIREEISYAVPEHRFEYLATYNDADIDAGVGTLHGQFFILRDIPVDELVVTEGSLRIVTPDEISSLTNSLTPIAKMVLKAALEREREFGAELENHATSLVFDQMEKQRKKRPKRLDE